MWWLAAQHAGDLPRSNNNIERAAGSRRLPVVAFGRLLRLGGVMRQKSTIAFVSGGRRAGVLHYGDEDRVE
jgi:hypothetical protein